MKPLLDCRHIFIGSLCIFLASTANAQATPESGWKPSRPVRIVLGYTPGGAADQVARELAPLMENVLGQPVVMDYKPGAAGAIAAETVANAAADGYTVGLADVGPLAIVPNSRQVAYDPVKSFSYIGLAVKSPLVLLVNPSVPAHNVQELVALLRKSPGAYSYSSSGLGSIHQLAGELFKQRTGTSMVHIPYRGASPAMTDLMSGQVSVSFATIGPAAPFVKQGKVRALGVTADSEVPALPGVKSIGAQGVPGYDAQGYFVLLGPKGMDAAAVQTLNRALNSALHEPAFRERMAALGINTAPTTPQEAQAQVQKDHQRWGKLIRELGLRFE